MNKTSAQVISAVFNPVINSLITFSLLAWADQQLNLASKFEFAGIADLIVAIISYWWKISIHTASMACSLVALRYKFGAIISPFYLLLLFVGQARIVLRRHTIAQAIAGALLGIVLTAIQLLSFKLA